MVGWETIVAAFGGVVLGVGLASLASRRRERKHARRIVELETRLRRVVVPVLERRADVLGIPPAERGIDEDGPVELALTLAQAIRAAEESGELPFGDTVEVARKELDAEVRRRAKVDGRAEDRAKVDGRAEDRAKVDGRASDAQSSSR